MTDFTTQPQSASFPRLSRKGPRFPAAVLSHLKKLLRPTRPGIDHISDHQLRDVGVHQTRHVRPIVSLGRIW